VCSGAQTYEGITNPPSPDNKHAAYVAQAGIERFVVVNGKEGRRYDDTGSLRYIFRKGNRIYSAEIRNIGANPDGLLPGRARARLRKLQISLPFEDRFSFLKK
jgi:hypothetical protein